MKKILLVLFALLCCSLVFAEISEDIASLPNNISDVFLEGQRQQISLFANPLLDSIAFLIQTNPDISGLYGLWELIVRIISATYLILIVFVGFKFLLGSMDEEQRADAKKWLKSAIAILVIMNITFYVYTVFLDVGSGLAATLWSDALGNAFSFSNAGSLDVINYGGVALLSFLVIATLLLRHFLLLLGAVIFPIGVFLYFLPPTKGHGSGLLNILALMVFMQVANVIVLIVADYFWQAVPVLEMYRMLFTLVFLLAVNIGFIFMAFGPVIGAAIGLGVGALAGGSTILKVVSVVRGGLGAASSRGSAQTSMKDYR